MLRRSRVCRFTRFVATIGLAFGYGVASGAEGVAPRTASGSVIALSTNAADDLPPLPPRDPSAPVTKQAAPTAPARTTTVVEVVVTDKLGDAPAISSMGWSAAGTSGRSRIDVLDGHPSGRSSISELNGEAAVESAQQAESRTVIVASDAAELLELGVIQTEAVFDGVVVMAHDLAPFPTSRNDDWMASELVTQLALAPEPLALPVAQTPPQLAPMPTSVDDAQPTDTASDSYVPPKAGAGDRSVGDLHKPLQTISLTAGFAKREPPDQSAKLLPVGGPQSIWGAPWPETCHRCYRYSVPFRHRPLYFEQPNLERCGVSCGIFTPYVSAAGFAGHVVLLPLHMLLDPPCTCVPTLGDCSTCERFGLCPHCNLAE